MSRAYNVLFLCTGNSARSILGEALLNHMGGGAFRASSAGSQPKGEVHPMALQVLEGGHISTEGLRSKSWDEFAGQEAPKFDYIFTVCDNAAGETCSIWPGRPTSAHWGIEDPAAVEGPGQEAAFLKALNHLRHAISMFLALPLDSLDEMSLREELRAIGRSKGATGKAEVR
jgi:arsenate reductase